MTTTMDPAEGNFGQIDGAGLLRHEQCSQLPGQMAGLAGVAPT
jgi:hypothetical protein